MIQEIPKFSTTQYAIINELGSIITKLGGKSDIITTLASWGDTLDDESVLKMLKEYDSKQVQRNFINLQQELPPAYSLIFVKRRNGSIYIGYRTAHALSANPDASKDCYWYGNSIIDLLSVKNFNVHFKNNFSDVTVESWSYIKP